MGMSNSRNKIRIQMEIVPYVLFYKIDKTYIILYLMNQTCKRHQLDVAKLLVIFFLIRKFTHLSR